ncbi:39S ribosomal protein L34, mitochondrial [Centrocercus urophasianus]|uniref:39S ribosomal protein L34, mitochondrial n=1 Tax=Centrocercus urophasianus TaxID=9002 RepID=UPI001C64F47C|nr:39S ribosomal protein L34, mitochondrial [Centrocercus urophasianus]
MAAALGRLWERAAGGRLFLLQQVAVHPSQLRSVSVFTRCRELPFSHLSLKPTGTIPSFTSPVPSWSHQQIRTKARGNEYQPNNRKRKRTHGWIKRISTPAGIEVILRRMLKGRKSLTH